LIAEPQSPPNGFFSDLIEILKVQLRDDTLTAIERDVLSGDGEDDRFTGILETSGL